MFSGSKVHDSILTSTLDVPNPWLVSFILVPPFSSSLESSLSLLEELFFPTYGGGIKNFLLEFGFLVDKVSEMMSCRS